MSPLDPAVFVSAEDTTDPREGAIRALPPEGNLNGGVA